MTQTNKVLLFISNVFVTCKGLFVVNIATNLAEIFSCENNKLKAHIYRNFHFTKLDKSVGTSQLDIVRERRLYLGVSKERDLLHLQRMFRER